MLDFLLIHQAQAVPRGSTQGESGGTRADPVPTAFVPGVAPVPCLMQRSPPVRGDLQARVRSLADVQVLFARDPGVKTGDRLIVLARGKIACVRCEGPAYDSSGLGEGGGIFGAATVLRVDGTLVS